MLLWPNMSGGKGTVSRRAFPIPPNFYKHARQPAADLSNTVAGSQRNSQGIVENSGNFEPPNAILGRFARSLDHFCLQARRGLQRRFYAFPPPNESQIIGFDAKYHRNWAYFARFCGRCLAQQSTRNANWRSCRRSVGDILTEKHRQSTLRLMSMP